LQRSSPQERAGVSDRVSFAEMVQSFVSAGDPVDSYLVDGRDLRYPRRQQPE